MPPQRIYTVEIDGHQYDLEGDHEPSESEARAAVAGQKPAPSTLIGGTSAKIGAGPTWADTIVNALPTVGGITGGMIGGAGGTAFGLGVGGVPGAIGGATLGGGLGESVKQLINRARGAEAPTSATNAASNIGTAGAVQGAGEAVGIGAAKALTPVAKGLYGLALRPIKSIRDKYGLTNLIREGFENRIMPTAAGATQAGARVTESRAAQRGMAGAYDAGGGQPLSVGQAAKTGLVPVIRKANAGAAATGAESGAPQVVHQIRRVVKTNGPRVKATAMMDLKHSADDIADPAYLAAARKGEPVPDVSEAGIAKGWSKGYRQTLNDAVGRAFAQQGLKTKTLYGVKKAALYSAERPEMASTIMSGVAGEASSGGDQGKALKNALIYRAMLSPRVQAGTALAIPGVAKYAPRTLDAVTGSNLEQYLRQALMAQLAGPQAQ